MHHFVLVYKRSTGTLEELRDFGADQSAALEARFEREKREAGDPDVEVVLLGAPSLDALKRTHARYFRTFEELVGDLAAALPRWPATTELPVG